MRILMLLDNEFPPDIRVENEALSLIKAGHEVHILSYNHGRRLPYELYLGIHVHRFDIHRQVAKKMLGLIHQVPLYKLIWGSQAKKMLGKTSFEAVHIHDLPLCFLANVIRKRFNIPVTADMHENYPYLVAEQPFMNSWFGKLFLSKKIWLRREKQWLESADHIICVATEMGDRLRQVLGEHCEITIVPNTLGFDAFAKMQVNVEGLKERFDHQFNVVYIGGIDTMRGIDVLIRAGSIIAGKIPVLKIILVGSGKIIPELEALSTSLDMEKHVVFEGWKPSSSVQSYIELSDVCVIPHLKTVQTDNSSPNKLFQYMYFGKPVISSNCRSLEKIIAQERCGLIFEDRNPADLADKLLLLYHNTDLKHSLGRNGYQAVMNTYNWDATSKGLLKIYSS